MNAIVCVALALCFCFVINCVLGAENPASRSWRDVVNLKSVVVVPDVLGAQYIRNLEELYVLEATQTEGSNSPVKYPAMAERVYNTNAPSPAPSEIPSTLPSIEPSSTPSSPPTEIPTELPSTSPSYGPTVDPFPNLETPKNPKDWYFQYDESSDYGPEDWHKVDLPPNYYWDEFGENGFGAWRGKLEDRRIDDNRCDAPRQSPVDLWANDQCTAMHEIRDLGGDFAVTGTNVQKQFLANKLRLKYRRRPCTDRENPLCDEVCYHRL